MLPTLCVVAMTVIILKMSGIIEKIRRDLVSNADEKTRISGERFFKEPVKLHGLKSAVTGKIGKEHYSKIKGKPKTEIFELLYNSFQHFDYQ